MAAAADTFSVEYACISHAVQTVDFIPSRETRESSNHLLQEHCLLSRHEPAYYNVSLGLALLLQLRRSQAAAKPLRLRSRSDGLPSAYSCGLPLKGKYVDIEFIAPVSTPRFGRVLTEFGSASDLSTVSGSRVHSLSDPSVGGAIYPLAHRWRQESSRRAVRRRKRQQTQSEVNTDGASINAPVGMDSPSFVVYENPEDGSRVESCGDQRSVACNGTICQTKLASSSSPPLSHAPASGYMPNNISRPRVTRSRERPVHIRSPRRSPPHSPPPPPPPAIISSMQSSPMQPATVHSPLVVSRTTPVPVPAPRRKSRRVACSAPARVPGEGSGPRADVGVDGYGSPAESDPVAGSDSDSNPRASSTAALCNDDEPTMAERNQSPLHSRERTESLSLRSEGARSSEGEDEFEDQLTLLHHPAEEHRPLTRSCPRPAPLLQDVPPAPTIGKTRPVPPPRRRKTVSETSQSSSQGKALQHSRAGTTRPRPLLSTRSTPDLFDEESPPSARVRTASFLHCKAGQDCGKFTADYLGFRSADAYVGAVDNVAKRLVDSKPMEVTLYITSERIRLAPPNSALLFKSFAMRDILSVQQCSKNKRIIGVVVWRPRSTPACHIVRCTDVILAGSLRDTVWELSQSIDDVVQDKVTHTPLPPPPARPSSHSLSSTGSDEGEVSPSVSPSSSPLPPPDPRAGSPVELLHKIPAVLVGSAIAGKLHSVTEIIQKVLAENRPSQAREISVQLSLAQVRLTSLRSLSEMVYATHETSRIRAIGVYMLDKRYIGYLIKEEGKPLMGYVLRCSSAGLMVSLMSFLRQSCQFTFYQRGGSFYDELSTDDSDDWDLVEASSPTSTLQQSPGLIKRLRSLTMSQSGSNSGSLSSQPSFVSHTPFLRHNSPLGSDVVSPSKLNSVHRTTLSHLDFTEEDFARFSVNYVGSAILDLPMTAASIADALAIFHERGVVGGEAAVPRNVIHIQISSLGINLTDKKHRLFVSRNYPRKQLSGYGRHQDDSGLFAFCSRRPGFPESMKCHVFRQVQEPVEQILDAVKFWLEMEPVG